MPELAEVEYFRRVWNAGAGERVCRVHLHLEKRVLRGTDSKLLRAIEGQKLVSSEAAGKQMFFQFTGDLAMGIHLGMTGKLSVGEKDYRPGKHDHLVLFQPERALVFTDARQFGRVLVHQGKELPAWWSSRTPAVTSRGFTLPLMRAFLERHPKLPIKGALLLQKGFPGIGNWMADEILWRAGISPKRRVRQIRGAALARLWRELRAVSRIALEKISADFGDPPKGWLFHQRWSAKGVCPKHKNKLRRETVAGRTTAWCPKCQK